MKNPAPSAADRSPSLSTQVDPVRVALAITLVLGVAFRLAEALKRSGLWADEAYLALNVMSRGPLSLLGHLDLAQHAPPLYLWAVRGTFLIGGPSELSLRLVSLVAGTACLFVLIPLARKIHTSAPLLMLAVFVPSFTLTVNSNELKPYIVDVLVAAILLLVTQRRLSGHGRSWTVPAALFLCSGFSFAAVFLGGGVVAALAVWEGRRFIWSRDVLWGAIAWLAGGILAIELASNSELLPWSQDYWAGGFAFRDATAATVAPFLRYFAGELLMGRMSMDGVYPEWVTPVALLLTAVGAVHLVRSNGMPMLLAILCPVALALVASALGKYPLTTRLWLWVLPGLSFLAVSGVYAGLSRSGPSTSLLALVLWVAAFGPRARPAFYDAHSGVERNLERRVLLATDVQRQPGEPIWVHARGTAEYLAFRVREPEDGTRLREVLSLASPGGPLYRNDSVMPPITPSELAAATLTDSYGAVLLGRPSGIRYRAHRPGGRLHFDWELREAARIRMAARPCIWTFMSRPRLMEREALSGALQSMGARQYWGLALARTYADRWCFQDP